MDLKRATYVVGLQPYTTLRLVLKFSKSTILSHR